jgi:AcrR family transcriptional regulator
VFIYQGANMVRPIKKKQIPNLQDAIKETAWQQIGDQGAPTLSLRAIARELKITAPAIYTYFPSRDNLVTALIVDAYNSLADAQEAAVNELATDNLTGRLSALGLAYREWAVTYPQRYQLIFGTPIPNYHAPEEVTLPAAARALVPLIRAIQEISSAGNLRTERLAKLTPKLKSMLTAWQKFEGGSDLEVLYLALVIWSRVHGLVMLEITNQMPSFFDDPAELFSREIKNILNQYL